MKQPQKILLYFETNFALAAALDEFAIYNNKSRSGQIHDFLKPAIERELENHPDLYELYMQQSHIKLVTRRGRVYRLKDENHA